MSRLVEPGPFERPQEVLRGEGHRNGCSNHQAALRRPLGQDWRKDDTRISNWDRNVNATHLIRHEEQMRDKESINAVRGKPYEIPEWRQCVKR